MVAALLTPNVRYPTVSVTVNGVSADGIECAEVTNSAYLAADRFLVRASLSASGSDIWMQDSLELSVQLGLNGNWNSLILGMADQIDIDPIRGEVTVIGRDLTTRLMASRTIQTFENQTSSDIAQRLAANCGLESVVTPTTQPVGREYQNNHERTSLIQYSHASTDWDLLTWLAQIEGFDIWVEQNTLFFMPPATGIPSVFISPSDCLSLRMARTPSLESSISVVVRSWNSLGQQAISQVASLPASTSPSASYVVTRPNLTSGGAQQMAQRMLAEMTQHARTITLEMPGDLALLPRMPIGLINTGTDFDGTYRICEVERRISFQHGFTQQVNASLPPWTAS